MTQSNYFKDIKRIAIISFQDSRKDLIEWSYANKNILKNHIVISTARTASLLEGTLNTPVLNLHHGKSGGYQQLKSLLEEKKIDIVLFFGNGVHHDSGAWFEELVNVAIKNDIVVAYNQATIDMILHSIAHSNHATQSTTESMNFLRNQMAIESSGVVTNG